MPPKSGAGRVRLAEVPLDLGAREVEGSHVIMLSQPQAVTDVILSAVAAVGQATAVNVGPAT